MLNRSAAVPANGTAASRAASRVGLAAVLVLAAILAAAALLALTPARADASGASPGLVIQGSPISGSRINVTEGKWSSYTVKLATQPSADVTVTLSPHNDSTRPVHVQWGSGQPRQKSTTFTPSNWNTAQTVNIWGTQDSDYQYLNGQWVAGVANEAEWVYHRATSSDDDYDREQEVLQARVSDDDGITATASSLTVTEGGSSTYNISLITAPAAGYTVSVSFSVAGDSDITVSPSSLSFNADNYTVAQTVTVSAAPDADTANGTATITHTATGGNYSYSRGTVAVTENDTGAAAVTPTPTPTPPPTPAPKASLIVTTPDECDKDTLDVNDNVIDGMKVAQGESCTFDVVLGKQPNADVAVNIYKYGDADGVLSYSPAKLTFTNANWDTKQTVTVTSAATQYHGLRQANMMIRTGNTKDTTGYHNLPWTYLRVNQVKGPGIILSAPGIVHSGGHSAISVTEGSSLGYDVKLNTKPTANVTVTVAQPTSGDTDLTLVGADSDNQRVLTFTPSNWNTAQLVTIAAAHDVDLVNGSRTFVNTAASDDSDYNDKYTDLTATEIEDDKASLVLSSTAVTVPEGGTATYTVKLSNQPSGAVTIDIEALTGREVTPVATEGDRDLRGSPGTLTFSTTNWNVAQTVTLTADEDGDDLAGTRTIRHTASDTSAEFSGLVVHLVATEGENDSRGFKLSRSSPITLNEGGSTTYTIKLGTEPTADVVIALNAEGDSDITVAPASMTFTSVNYATAQTVTISAAEDDTDYADDTANISHSITTTDAIYVEQFIGTMHVTAKENDAALVLSVNTLQVPENGTAEYTVALTNRPTGDVTVTITEGTTTNDDTSITVTRPSSKVLTFTTATWNSPTTVTLRAASDSDAVNGTRTISHTASGGGFDSAPAQTLTAIESDTRATVILRNSADTANISSIAVTEGSSATYKVELGAQPSSDVTVTVGRTGDTNVTASPASLTFTSSNWDTPQTVTLSAASDTDLANGTATITHSAANGGFNGKSASLTATETDNTGQVVLRNAADNANITAITVPENGNTTYKVELSHQPTGGTVAVRITYASGGDTSITRSPTSLYFTRTNWNVAQTVTLRASNDSDTTAGARSIVHTATGGGYNSPTKTLTATEAEDDYAVVLRNAADSADISTISVTEGSTATYKVELSIAPTGSVTVAVAAATTGSNVDPSITVSPATLTFTANNWSTAQTVTLTAAEDNTDIINGKRNITHTASGANYNNTPVASLTATEADNDTGTIVLRNNADNADITTIDVPENGNINYKVKLSHQPQGNVTIRMTYASGGDSDITYNKSSLYFNATNWSTLQTVTLRARDDSDQLAGTRTINHTSTGGGYTDTAALAATEAENDKSVILTPSSVSVGEGSTANYTVKLSVLPTSDVIVTIAAGTGDSNITVQDTDDSQSGNQTSTITFTTTNWSTARTVVLAAAQDADILNGTRSITHTSTSTDAAYNNKTVTLTATEADNDSGTIKIRNAADSADISTLNVNEGGSATYKVKLSMEPRASVTVNIAGATSGSYTDSDITVSPSSLTFTTRNWDTAKTVTLRAAQDADLLNGIRSIRHTGDSTDNGYPTTLLLTLAASEVDNDTGAVLIRDSGDTSNINAASVTEGSTATYKIKLSKEPRANVTVTVAAATTGNATDSDITVSPATLTFSSTTWSTAQTVTLTAAEDNGDLTNGSRAITHTASGANSGYVGAAVKTLTATEADNDTNGAILIRNAADDAAITTQGVREGGTATYKVKLDKQPRANVTVTVSQGAGDTDITVISARTLTFTPNNWNTAKSVTLRATQDAGTAFGTRTITHTPSGTNNGYASAASLTAQEYDDDVMIEISDSSNNDTDAVLVREGSTASYMVKLSQLPLADVTVAITSTGDRDITFSPSSLTFTRTGSTIWSTAQEVTVSAAADTDTSNGTKTIRHNASGGGYDYAATASVTAREQDGPTLSLTATAITATMTISQHTNAWWYKIGGSPTCRGPVAQGTDTHTTTATLVKNTEYSFTAYSDSNCATALTPSASITTLNPALASSNVGATSATLTLSGWDLTKDGSWYYKHASGTCSGVQSALTASVTGLTKNTAYVFTAYASSTCAATIVAAPSFTTLNTALAASGTTATTTTLTLSGWTISTNGNWYYKANVAPHTTCSDAQTSLTANLTGLSVNTSYTYTAYSDAACSTSQAVASAFTTKNPYLQSSVTSNSVTVSIWNWTISKDGSWYLKETTNSCRWTSGVTITLSALQSNTSYTYQGFSDSSCTTGNEITAQHTATTTAGGGGNSIQVLGQQVEKRLPSPVTGLTVSRQSDFGIAQSSSIVASWDASQHATGYDVVYSTDGEYSWTRAADNQPATTFTLSNANEGLSYVIAVQAVNQHGSSGWTDSDTVPATANLPGSVTGLSATHNGNSISVTWDAADYAASYDIVYSTDGKYTWSRAATEHVGTTYTLTGVDGGSNKSYVIAVRGVNGVGTGSWTNSDPVSPPNNGATYDGQGQSGGQAESGAVGASAPGAPTFVGLSHHGGRLSVTWTTSATATSYDVQVGTADAKDEYPSSWSTATCYTSGANSCNIYSGVSSANNYAVRVRATNTSGSSAWTGSILVWYITGSAGGASGA